MNTLNQFFQVQFAVRSYRDARFDIFSEYEKKLQTVVVITIACACFALTLISIAIISITMLAYGFVLGCGLFLYAMFQNTRALKFLRSKSVFLFFEMKIEEKVLEVKLKSRDQLYHMKEVIENMKFSSQAWKNTAADASRILEFQSV